MTHYATMQANARRRAREADLPGPPAKLTNQLAALRAAEAACCDPGAQELLARAIDKADRLITDWQLWADHQQFDPVKDKQRCGREYAWEAANG